MQDTETDRAGGLSLREAAGQAVLLAALLAAAFPGVFFRGEMISPADIAFQQPPWASYAPADWEGPSNPLMADALILADAYYPGWTATVNGTPAAIVPVYSVFRGVAVPEGRAEVRFTYFPAAFRTGLACSVLALSAGSVAGLFLLRRSRRRAS